MIAGNSADLGNVMAGDPPKPKITPIRAVRRMALAENIYAQKHPDMGFTCAISNLVNVGRGLDDGEPFSSLILSLPAACITVTALPCAAARAGRQNRFRWWLSPSMARAGLIAPMIDSICGQRTTAGEPHVWLQGASPATDDIEKWVETVRAYFPACATLRLFCTSKTPGTPFALSPARSLSPWLFTTPSRLTWPPFTMI